MQNQAVILDLSKCGGVCYSDCQHFAIGIACGNDQKYRPRDGNTFGGCECSSWCRAEPQPITDRHHMNCQHYNDTIRVVKITHNGSSSVDTDIPGALAALADGDDYEYHVEIMQMLKREYEALPEFEGF